MGKAIDKIIHYGIHRRLRIIRYIKKMKKLLIFSALMVAIPTFAFAVEGTPAATPAATPQSTPLATPPPSSTTGTSVAPPSSTTGPSTAPHSGGTYTSIDTSTTPPSSTGGSGSNGASSNTGPVVVVSSGGTSGGNYTAGTFVPIVSLSCPLLKVAVMERGWNNDHVQVVKLQSFLKSQELDVTVNGIYDQKTEDAVKAFQTQYASTIMAPWGATEASGIVYITTVKKINEMACQQPLTLSSAELAIINSYKNSIAESEGENTNGTPAVTSSDELGSTTVTSTDVTSNSGQIENTAAVGYVSIWQRFWDFIGNLFRNLFR